MGRWRRMEIRRTDRVKALHRVKEQKNILYANVSQPPGPGISCTGPREVLLEFVILVF